MALRLPNRALGLSTSPSSRPSVSPPLAVTTLPAARRDQAARIWAGLLDQSGTDELTTSWLWVSTWLDAFGADTPHRFLVAMGAPGTPHAGQPVAITLATAGRGRRRGPIPVRTAHLGTAGERGGVYVEYNRIVALPGHRPAALAAFTRALARPRWGILPPTDYVELNGFAPEELDGWDAAGFTVDHQVCRVVDLDALRAAGTPLEKAFGSQIGRKLRKNARWFAERHGSIAAEWITDPARAQVVFGELIDLHQARWVASGEPGSFANPAMVRFHRAMIDALLPRGRAILLRVTAGEQLVGVSYAFDEHGSVNHYNWGLMAVGPEDGSLSPGFVLAVSLLQACLDRGYREVNWLGGDSRWKKELSTATRDLIWAERPVGPWPVVVRAATATKRLAMTARSHSAVLRTPAVRLRRYLRQPVFSRSSYDSARGLLAPGAAVDMSLGDQQPPSPDPQPTTPEVPHGR